MKVKAMILAVLTLVVLSTGAFADSYTVYVGYADNLRASGFFPNPWASSPNVVFVGQNGSSAQLDSGAIRIDNTGTTAITVNDVTYHQSSGATYDLWGASVLNPGQRLILDQTAQFNFDSSDTNDFMPSPDFALAANAIGGCNNLSAAYTAAHIIASNLAATCAANIGTVTVTVNGVPTTFQDSGSILNTGGYDFVFFSADGNESINWNQIGTSGNRGGSVPEPSSLILLASGLLGIGSQIRRRMGAA